LSSLLLFQESEGSLFIRWKTVLALCSRTSQLPQLLGGDVREKTSFYRCFLQLLASGYYRLLLSSTRFFTLGNLTVHTAQPKADGLCGKRYPKW